MIYELMRFISAYKIMGIIPADLLIHFVLGLVITVIGLKRKMPLWKVFVLLVFIALLKELNDYYFHTFAGWREYIEDFLFTILYIFVLFVVRQFKNRHKNHEKKISL